MSIKRGSHKVAVFLAMRDSPKKEMIRDVLSQTLTQDSGIARIIDNQESADLVIFDDLEKITGPVSSRFYVYVHNLDEKLPDNLPNNCHLIDSGTPRMGIINATSEAHQALVK